MGTKIKFENAVLADAVTKANRVAPTKGAAFDKAAGFKIDVKVSQSCIILSSTDLEVSFKMRVPALQASGDDVTWRVPSKVLAGIVAGLSMAAEAATEFIDRGDGKLRLKSSHTAVALNMITGLDYPEIPDYSHDGMTPAQAVTGRIEQVSWSRDSTGTGAMSGLRVTGTHLVGVNPFGIAIVPCEVNLPEPVTVPLYLLTPLLKGASDVRMRADGERFIIALDPETTVTTQLILGEFVQYEQVLRENFAAVATVRKQSFLDCLNQILVLINTDRQPTICLTLDGESSLVPMLRLDAEVEQVGRMQTGLDVSTEFDGTIRLYFKPSMLLDAVDHAKGETVTFSLGHADDPSRNERMSLCIADGGGYKCYIMPMKGA